MSPQPGPVDVGALRAAAEAATEFLASGNWRADPYGKVQIWGDSLKGGDTHVADVRGWGYLTGRGTGALSLDEATGIRAQEAIARHIALANPATILALLDMVPLADPVEAASVGGDGLTDDDRAKIDGLPFDLAMKVYRAFVASRPAAHPAPDPVPVSINCPECGLLHLDEGEWATRPHKTHQCQGCGHEWRPFPYATVGVAAPDPLAVAVDALNHYRCSCDPGHCAMSLNGDDEAVDDQLCGRVAAAALATLKEGAGE